MSPPASQSDANAGSTVVTTGSPAAADAAGNTSKISLNPKSHLKPTFRKDYKPTDFTITKADLDFNLHPSETQVRSELTVEKATHAGTTPVDLRLDGEDLVLKSIAVDGVVLQPVGSGGYTLISGGIIIDKAALPQTPGKPFKVVTQVTTNPDSNLSLMGLYRSKGIYCTQCEAEGFRKITYFLDRPDVLALFTVRLEAPKDDLVLLSNGNLIGQGDVDGNPNRHFAKYGDPFPKPCYLFALVAGSLLKISDVFTTMSGRKVDLHVYSEAHSVKCLDWALQSLKLAMTWDEKNYGREYDLNVFNIVAVDDFNMGAMENKSLNIFNSALLLASKDTSTDDDFLRVAGVVAHEYFHNWTGNRVTCRDWFQLTLKEGLTVYRDSCFSRDCGGAAVKRIDDVISLRSRQFPEDAGPMAHPIRPESYISMDNFYTATVYSKGAEVIGMYSSILTKAGFRKGTDLYFERHDGQAVTCDDFRAAMADANGVDLSQFERWYLQPGTPVLTVQRAEWNAEKKTYTLKVAQSCPSSTDIGAKWLPMHVVLAVGLIGRASRQEVMATKFLHMKEEEQEFVFEDIAEDCVASLNRDFAAPIKLVFPEQTTEDLCLLLGADTDPFNKWDACQRLLNTYLVDRAVAIRDADASSSALEDVPLPAEFLSSFSQLLQDPSIENGLKVGGCGGKQGSGRASSCLTRTATLLYAVCGFSNRTMPLVASALPCIHSDIIHITLAASLSLALVVD
eukprot:GHVU01146561.1.p1 GENE.GHVU01146561.1~~GHVU01146561.1.p1  ORF type:complete len:735 (+),score=139.12 GHVU01146561.1:639-2843(+)